MSGNAYKILVVDDNYDIRNLLTRYLEKQNYRVSQAVDGNSAYNELKYNMYDLCLLDINMPGQNGIKVLSKIKQANKIDTAIVMITGCSETSVIIKIMRLGAVDYIQKPFHYEELKIVIKRTLENRKIRLENIRYKYYLEKEIDKKTIEIKSAYLDIVNAFANTIGIRDHYTGRHAQRVCRIALILGEKIGFNSKELYKLKIGALLHDIGKIGIADKILKKPKRLTKKEFNEIKKHPQIGYTLIKGIKSLTPVIPYILSHHERYDGCGYPQRLKGKEIPIEGRILALADALEAMTGERPYRKCLSLENVYEEIVNNAGTQFDPEIVEIFVKLWKENKIKSAVSNSLVRGL